ncbi:hypothetical protein QUF90_17855 [Desulfococcaceae bacterium HSG9]|nr:hypothetical protein [Desulfococcaceae bacterium HSG9]
MLTDTILSNELAIRKGIVVEFAKDGMIFVETEESEFLLPCYFVRTAEGALPQLNIGASVLFVSDSDQEYGYILGLIEVYVHPKKVSSEKDALLTDFENQVEIELSSKAKDIKVNDKKIIIEAEDEIHLKCGKGMIMINKEGKVILRGTNLISRSSGSNKIKGAAVQIN